MYRARDRLAVTLFEATTVIVFGAHDTMDFFSGAVAARLVAGAEGRLARVSIPGATS